MHTRAGGVGSRSGGLHRRPGWRRRSSSPGYGEDRVTAVLLRARWPCRWSVAAGAVLVFLLPCFSGQDTALAGAGWQPDRRGRPGPGGARQLRARYGLDGSQGPVHRGAGGCRSGR
ncbi:hypothetical protein HBB16_05575 [Pseudonocardia sp. MCCB 268]|nr:hypothetical protein [Pseudonocardia cytotoxica]